MSSAPDRMGIAHVVPYFPPDKVGGVGEIVDHLHRGLLERGHDSIVLTTGTTRDDPTIHRLAETPLGFVTGCWRRIDLLEDRDIVQFQHGDAIALLAAIELLQCRVARLVSYHVDSWLMGRSLKPQKVDGHRFGHGIGALLKRNLVAGLHCLVDRLAGDLADDRSFFSQSAARDVLGSEAARSAQVIYDGLPPSPQADGTVDIQPTELLYVGTFGLRKRTHLLPAILREVRRSLPAARLRLIGASRDEQSDLAALFDAWALGESVVWEGRLRSEQIPAYYRAARVLVVPSAYEGLPTVILEALRSGLPCVATRVSGNPEVIADGINGFLVDVDRPESLAEKAARIAGNRALRESMSLAARATVEERFNVERLVSDHLRLYRRMIRRVGQA